LREVLLQDAHMAVPVGHAGVYLRAVLVCGTPAHQRHERVAPRIIEFSGLPIHPLSDHGSLLRQRRHHRVGIAREERGVAGALEACAPVFARKGQVQFVASPQHLAHIDRCSLAQDGQHAGVFR
jgi:hypothetical protein